MAPGSVGDDAPVIGSASGWYVTPTSVKAVVFDASEEHSRIAFFLTGALPQPLAASYRQAIALAARDRSHR